MSLLNSASRIYLGATPVDAMHANGVRVWPPAVAVAEDFFTGDGVTQQTRLQLAGHPVTNPTVTAMHRTDWQGRQLLYPTARTNLLAHSLLGQINTGWEWYGAGSTFVADDAPDGSSTATLVTTAGPGYGFREKTSHAITSGGMVTVVADLKYVAGSAVVLLGPGWDAGSYQRGSFNLKTGTVAQYGGGAPAKSFSIEPLPESGWYRCVVTGVAPSATGVGLYVLGQTTGDQFIVGEMRVALQDVPVGAVIHTDGAPVTVTDYAYTSDGQVTLGQKPAVGAVLDWDGTGLLVD